MGSGKRLFRKFLYVGFCLNKTTCTMVNSLVLSLYCMYINQTCVNIFKKEVSYMYSLHYLRALQHRYYRSSRTVGIIEQTILAAGSTIHIQTVWYTWDYDVLITYKQVLNLDELWLFAVTCRWIRPSQSFLCLIISQQYCIQAQVTNVL